MVEGIPLVNLPDVCTEQPMPGKAFCSDHCAIVEKHNIPTGLRDFLKHAQVGKIIHKRLVIV